MSGLRTYERRRRVAGTALSVAGAIALVFASTTLAGASYGDPSNDANDAPDITAVTVSTTSGATVTVSVALRNFQSLPADAEIVVRFDLDRDPATGASGDELVVRYSADGSLDVQRWNGFALVSGPSPMSSEFAEGRLTLAIPDSELGDSKSFSVRAIASRTQIVGLARIVASDSAPAGGAGAYSGSGDASFVDAPGDEDVAPDITGVDVSDTKDGTIAIRIEIGNYPTPTPDKLFGVDLDLVGRPTSADDVFLTYLSSTGAVEIDREVGGLTMPDRPPHRARATYDAGAVTMLVHRSELDDAGSFRFSIVTADIVGRSQADGPGSIGAIEAVDVAPDGVLSGRLFSYRLAHAPPVHLDLEKAVGSPARPRAGRPFAVDVVARRSDTYQAVRSGSVRCRTFVGATPVRALGAFVRGRARCSIVVPAGGHSIRVRGTIVIRAAGATARSSFSFAG